LYYYSQFCNQKHLKFTPDSFSKFVFHTMWDEVIYCKIPPQNSW
jgi:hypothetical protein